MKIAIDARFINPENRGLACYTKNLIDGLQKIDNKNQYFILLRKKDYATLNFLNPRFNKIEAEAQWYGIKEQLLIPKILNKIKPDITHFPHFNVPLSYNKSFIATIHDLILFTFPTKKATTLNPLTYFIKEKGYRLTIKHALQKSRYIISVSESTKKDILRFFPKISKEKIIKIYEGAGEDNTENINKYSLVPEKDRRNWISSKLNIKFPYIFYLGGAYPHKNLDRLIFAFQKAKNYLDQNKSGPLNLVIAGGEDYFFNQLKQIVRKNKIKDIIFPGFIKEIKTLEYLYQEAEFCIFPSLYEGFGLPPLEALKRNKIVLCSKSTAFPEILDSAAIYFDGKSINQISEKIIDTHLSLAKYKSVYLPKAARCLEKYDWEEMSKKTLEIYTKSV